MISHSLRCSNSVSFVWHRSLLILNKQDKHIQFTIEDENGEKCLNFLDIKIKNNNGRYEFDVHRKPALTNIQINPQSSIPPDTITGIFKGFLARATKICSENI